MKKIALLPLSLIIISFVYLSLNKKNAATSNYKVYEIEDEGKDIEGAFAYQFNRIVNPYTGEIPHGAVLQAYNTLKKRGFYTNASSAFRIQDMSGWQPVNDFFPTLAISKITYDPNNTNIFYFSTGEGWGNADEVRGNGVFKSTDAGETWNQLASTDIPIFDYCQDIGVHPITSDVYVATSSGGLQRSKDGGLTWQKVLGNGAGSLRNSIADIAFTNDGGVFVGIGIFEVDGVYYSPSGDSGTYTKQTIGLPASVYRYKLATAPSNADVAYAIPCATNLKIAGIYRTSDRGATWQATNLPGGNLELAASQAWYDLSLAVDPNDENIVVAGGLNIWRTKDGGGTWQQLTSGRLDSSLIRYVHVDQHEVVFQNSDTVYFTNDGGIYKSDNFSSENPFIYNRNYGYNVTQYYAISIDPRENNFGVIGGTQDNGSTLALNYGLSEIKPVSGKDGAFVAYNTNDANIFYTASQYRDIYRFTNGGYEIPDTITNPYLAQNNIQFINPFEINPTNSEVIFQASNISLWRLDSASVTDSTGWEKACTFGGVITAIGVSINPPDIAFIGRNSTNGEIFALYNASTVDNSSSPLGLDPLNQLPSTTFTGSIYCSSIAVDPNDANHIIITYSNYGIKSIWESTNALSGSPTWQSVEGDFPDVPVYWALINPGNSNVCYIATELGVFYTNQLNGDETQWIPSSNFPVVSTYMLRARLNDFTIEAGTHGRGIWEAKLDATGMNNDILWAERGPVNVGGRTRTLMIDPNDPTNKTIWAGSVAGGLWKTTNIDAVPVENIQTPSTTFNVYPNPLFNSEATIQIKSANAQNVFIDLFDMKGNLIEHVLSDQNIPAQYIFMWHIKNNLNAGIYFVVMKNEVEKITKKIIVL